MEKITSFTVNHNTLKEGLYISRIDGDITTYDIRTRKPNSDDFMSVSTMHTMEHMLATYLRNSNIKDKVIYFGPMGCQTGFYLLIRDAEHKEVVEILLDCVEKVIEHQGDVFGNSAIECGNYKTLDLENAKEECRRYIGILKTVDYSNLNY